MKKAIMLTLATLLIAGSVAAAPEALAQKGGKGKDDAPARPLPPRPEFTTGIVSSYVPESRTLKFNTGGEYKLTPAAVAATTIHTGDKVQLRWLMKGGLRIADEAMITQAGINPAEAVQASKPAPAAAPATTDKPAATTASAPPS